MARGRGNAAPGGARNSALQMGVMGGLAVHVAAGILDVAPQLATLFGGQAAGVAPLVGIPARAVGHEGRHLAGRAFLQAEGTPQRRRTLRTGPLGQRHTTIQAGTTTTPTKAARRYFFVTEHSLPWREC